MMKNDKPTTQRKNPVVLFLAGLLANWQIIASAGLLTAGVVGLSQTHDDYCGMTDLAYAPSEIVDDLEAASQVSGFRSGVLAAQLETESHWVVDASSHAGAQGLAQFTTDTWEKWGDDGNIDDPHDAVAAQARYLAYLEERLAPYIKSDADRLPIVMAGYNAGPSAVEESKGVPPYFETQEYVRKITELSNTKYKVTCDPDPSFKQSKITYVDG